MSGSCFDLITLAPSKAALEPWQAHFPSKFALAWVRWALNWNLHKCFSSHKKIQMIYFDFSTQLLQPLNKSKQTHATNPGKYFQPSETTPAAIYWVKSGKGQKRLPPEDFRRLTLLERFQIQKTRIPSTKSRPPSIVSKVWIFLHLWSVLAVFENLWQVFFPIFFLSRQFWEKLKLAQ